MTNPFAILCVICNGEIEIGKVKYVNDEGKPVHEPCYVEQVTKKPSSSYRMRGIARTQSGGLLSEDS